MKTKEERQRDLERRIEEINKSLPEILKNPWPRVEKPEPGCFFYADAGNITRDLFLLERQVDGKWLCALGSIEVDVADEYDLLLQPGQWIGGFPYMIEVQHTILIEEIILMKEKFHQGMTPESVGRSMELYDACKEGVSFSHLDPYVGQGLDICDRRAQFEFQEFCHMFMIRKRYQKH